MEFATSAVKKGILVRTVGRGRMAIIKKFERAEKAIGRDEAELVLCSLTSESKTKENENKKVQFTEDVKQPSAGMMCTINGNKFFLFTKNTRIRDLGTSCHITNDDTGLYNIININESIQGSSGIMPAMTKGKLQVIVHQVNRTEQSHTLWPVKFCPMAGANLFSLTCELSWGNKISSDQLNNMINTPNGNIVLDRQIRTCDGWVTGVDFLLPLTKRQCQQQPYPRETSRTFTLS